MLYWTQTVKENSVKLCHAQLGKMVAPITTGKE